jgi:GTPase SAR1 family protein
MNTTALQTKRARIRKGLLDLLRKPLHAFLTALKTTFVDPLRPGSQQPPRPPVKKLPPHPRPIKPPGAQDNQPKPSPTNRPARRITTVLGTDAATGQEVGLTLDERFQSVYIIGANGTGKTTLIENMILSDISNNHGLCLIEPYGDLTKNVIAAMPKERLKDLIYLDLTDSTSSFGLNFFECPLGADDTGVAKVASFVMHLFESIWNVGFETPRLQTVIRNITRVLIENPGMTFAEIGLLLWDDGVREKLVRRVTNTQTKLFWSQYNKKVPRDREELIASTINKVDAYLN